MSTKTNETATTMFKQATRIELFNTEALDEIISSISEEEKKALELETCDFRFSEDHNLVVIEGPVSVVANLKDKIPFFVRALKTLRAWKEKELDRQVEAEVKAYMAAMGKSNS